MNESGFKPTINKPVSQLSKGYENNFKKTMDKYQVNLSEADEMLNEREQSLKKKIFSLAKMEALVFSDPKLAAVYEEMSLNGEEKYGYHYNETIMNMLFNDYVLNSAKYLQKYKQAVPKEKKRRDKSGINQLKQAGEDTMDNNTSKQPVEKNVEETTGAASSGAFAAPLGQEKTIDETTTASSAGGAAGYVGYAGPAAWGAGDLIKGKKGKAATVPIIKGGTIIQENYLTDPTGFEKMFNQLNEADLSYNDKLNKDYKQTHTGSNNGLGVSEKPQNADRTKKIQTIEDNTSLYIGQDAANMPDKDVDILHNDMTKNHSYFPHPKNPNLKDDGISGIKENREEEDEEIIDKTSAFTSNTVKNWNDKDTNTEMNTLKTGKMDNSNLQTENKELEEVAKSKSQQRLFGMAHAVQKGELSPNKVSGAVKKIAKTVKPEDVEDFASTKHKKLPEKVDEDTQTMIQSNGTSMSNKATAAGEQSSNIDMGTRSMNESESKLLEEINNELNAFSIYHDKLKRMSEDRKPSSLVLKDRLGSENTANFKKDLKDSSIGKIVDIENELEYKDQQTEVTDPQKLGADLEKNSLKTTKGVAFKNVGNSENDKGDEIPKRNLTTEEQDEVNNYRLGLGDYVYDNKPSQKFEDRMKADMGDKLYKQRQDKLEFRGKAPMYNKDAQPTEKAIEKNQFDKEKTGWNEREGLKECEVTGKFYNAVGKKSFIDFKLNEVKEMATPSNTTRQTGLFELSLDGLGNTYTNKVNINEDVVKVINENKFYTDGVNVFTIKNQKQNLSESDNKVKKPVNEQFNKMKHLSGYKPDSFTNTKNNTRF